MSYPSYLRQRSSECIRIAVESAGRPGTDELIDLAQDYATWATSFERKGPAAPALPDRDGEPAEPVPATAWTHMWWRVVGKLH